MQLWKKKSETGIGNRFTKIVPYQFLALPLALQCKMRQIQTFKDSANKYWPELLNETLSWSYLPVSNSMDRILEGESDQIEFYTSILRHFVQMVIKYFVGFV